MISLQAKTSFNKFKSIYSWVVKRYLGISILYSTILFLIYPFAIILCYMGNHSTDFLLTLFPFVICSTSMLFTLIMSGMVFSYLHKKRSIDLFHSLPVKKSTLFLARYFAGLTLILVPLILISIVSIFLTMSDYSLMMNFIQNDIYLILAIVASFTFSAFIAVCSGNLVDMIVSILAINVVYPATITLIFLLPSYFLAGQGPNFHVPSIVVSAFSPYFSTFFPYFHIYNYETVTPFVDRTGLMFILWWIFFSVAFLFISISLYNKRKSEASETGFAFPLPTTIIRFISSLAVGIAVGILFLHVVSYTYIMFIIGFLLGSFISHIVIDAIYSRGLSNFKNSLKYYLIVVLTLMFILFSLGLGFFGYDSRIPELNDVKSVSISNTISETEKYTFDVTPDYWDKTNNNLRLSPELEENASISSVIDLHKSIVNNLKSKRGYPYRPILHTNDKIQINYTLRNGSTLTRSYLKEDLNETILRKEVEITYLPEYKNNSKVVYKISAKDIESIALSSDNFNPITNLNMSEESPILTALKDDFNSDNSNHITDLDISKKASILTALKNDLNSDTAEKRYLYYASDNNNTMALTLYSYSNYYDNPDMKKNSFSSSYYIIPNYYQETISVLTSYGLM